MKSDELAFMRLCIRSNIIIGLELVFWLASIQYIILGQKSRFIFKIIVGYWTNLGLMI